MKKAVVLLMSLLFVANVQAATFMSVEWAEEFCDTWNETDTLMSDLGGSFVENDGGRGYKMMVMYRRDCSNMAKVQVTLEQEDGLAICVDSGLVVESTNFAHDYLMSAKTKNWIKMGTGDLGPAGAMMTGRLKFSGPKKEAMSFMGPFKGFLRLTGALEADYACE